MLVNKAGRWVNEMSYYGQRPQHHQTLRLPQAKIVQRLPRDRAPADAIRPSAPHMAVTLPLAVSTTQNPDLPLVEEHSAVQRADGETDATTIKQVIKSGIVRR
jgi:hypothetical protein